MNAARKTSPAATPLRSALVVTANPGHARVDRLSLKNAKVAVSRAVKSGSQAREMLLKAPADVVLVDEQLEDGPGWDFMRSLKADPALRHIPVILITSAMDRERVLEAIRLGCVGFLLRPYTLDAFFKHLGLARQSRCFLKNELDEMAQSLDMVAQVQAEPAQASLQQAEQAVPQFEKALETADDARHFYETGLRALARQDFAQAVEAFTRASRLSVMMTEAHLGLARCWLTMGDEVRYRKSLTQAADACARAKRFEHYKDEFLTILKADPRSFNPFVSLGLRLRREMDLDGALMALKNAVWLSPNDAHAHLELAKVWHFKREPELAKRSVGQALMLSPHDGQAQELYTRWTGMAWGQEERVAEETSGERKPLIPDVIPAMLNGVLYLAGVLTEGIHRIRRDHA